MEVLAFVAFRAFAFEVVFADVFFLFDGGQEWAVSVAVVSSSFMKNSLENMARTLIFRGFFSGFLGPRQ